MDWWLTELSFNALCAIPHTWVVNINHSQFPLRPWYYKPPSSFALHKTAHGYGEEWVSQMSLALTQPKVPHLYLQQKMTSGSLKVLITAIERMS